MTIRRVNFTRRKRIAREDVHIWIDASNDGILFFDAKINLDKYNLPSCSRIFIEAYHRMQYMRFDFGRIGEITPPKDKCLYMFKSKEEIKFRVKIVSNEDPRGILQAEADGIRATSDEEKKHEKKTILKTRSSDQLGDEIWKLEFEEDLPVLLINNNISKEALETDQIFRALVLPSIVRLVLREIVLSDSDEEQYSWKDLWLKYARRIHKSESDPESDSDLTRDEKENWVEDVVQAFCHKHRLLESFLHHWSKE